MDIFQLLNNLADELNDDVRNVNRGGCAVLASHVGKHLRKVPGVKDVQLRVGDDESDHQGKHVIDLAREAINEANLGSNNARSYDWNDHGVSFGHVLVEFKHGRRKYHYDTYAGVIRCRRTTALHNYPLYKGGLTIEEGMSIASVADGWNDCFNRRQIPKMKRIIKKHFELLQ